jgi:hypothetical protein
VLGHCIGLTRLLSVLHRLDSSKLCGRWTALLAWVLGLACLAPLHLV